MIAMGIYHHPRQHIIPADTIVGEIYRIGQPIGAGNSAIVYEATNINTDEEVAVKQIIDANSNIYSEDKIHGMVYEEGKLWSRI